MTTDLTIYTEAEAMVADLVAKDAAQEHDHTTPEGEKALRSWVRRVKGGCGDIEKARKDGKAGLIKMGKLIDDKAKELTAPLRAIQAARMKPLDEIAAKEKAEKEAFLKAEEEKRAAQEEADRKELEELRAAKEESDRKEREAKIAEEAAAKATEVAEAKAEAKIQEVTRLAEENRPPPQKFVAPAAMPVRTTTEDHRRAIEAETFHCINDVVRDVAAADLLVEAIKAGKIKNVQIIY
jgi:hypothetical protein